MNVGEIQAVMRLETDQWDRAMDQVSAKARTAGTATAKGMESAEQGTRKAGAAATKTAAEVDKAADAHGRAAKKMGDVGKGFQAVAGVVAGSLVAQYIGQSIKAASDLNETVSKGRQIFGAQAAAIEAWSDSAATSLGVSKQAALEAASNFGNLFTQIGFTSQEAAKMSQATVQMSADLGSFNNLPTADVADRISAAFRGEYDSLQLVIPTINAAAVETEALRMTGEKNADALSQQQKAAAVLSIVNRDGARAMGDFARTSDGFANSSKTLTARLEEQKAELGEKLMPVAMTVMKLFSDVGVPALGAFGDVLGIVAQAATPFIEALGWILRGFQGLPEPLQVAVVAFTAVTLLRGPLNSMATGVEGLTGKVKGLGTALKAAFMANPVGLVITAIATAVSFFTGSTDDAKESTERWRGEVADLKGTLDQANGAVTALTKNKLTDMIGHDVLSQWARLGIDTKLVIDGITGVAGASEKSSSKLKELAGNYIGTSQTVSQFSSQLRDAEVTSADLADALLNGVPPELNDRLRAVGLSLYTAADGQLALKNEATGTSQAINDQNGSLDVIKQAYDKQNGLTSNLATSQGELAVAMGATGAAYSDAERPVGRMTALWEDGEIKADELKLQVDELMLAIDRLAGRNGDAEAAQRALNSQMRDYAGDLRRVEEATLKTEEATKAYNDAVRTHGKNSEQAREASRALADAQDAQADSADNVKESEIEMARSMAEAGQTAFNTAIQQGNLTGATDAATVAMQKVRDAFIASQSPADIASGKAANLATQLGLIPTKVATTIQANSENAVVTIDGVEHRLNVLDGKIVTATVYADFKSRVDTTIAQLRAQGNPFAMAEGGLVVSGNVVHAAAGLLRQPAMVAGGTNAVHFAESSIPWESYVSGDPAVAGRSHAIMGLTAARLGGKYAPPGVTLPSAAPPALGALPDVLARLADAIATQQGKVQLGEVVNVYGVDDLNAKFYELSKLVGR